MKRSSSAPSLAENSTDCQRKRIRAFENDDKAEPNAREYLQLALGRVLEMQRSLDSDSIDETSDLGESDNEDDVMRHVLTRVFHDLPETTSTKIAEMIESGKQMRRELVKVRAKSIQLSGYDTCRKVAIDFMKSAVSAESPYRSSAGTDRRHSVGNANFVESNARQESYEVRQRMLTGLDLHLAAKQRDYTSRLMRH